MKVKKWGAVMLTATMSVSLLAACGGGGGNGSGSGSGTEGGGGDGGTPKEESNFNATGFPIMKEPINLAFFTGKSATTANNWNETMLWQEYAKMTNINVDFQLVPFDNLTERRNLVLAGGDYPDAFHTARITTQDLAKYGSQGIFIPLNDLIDKYAPNLKKLMDENPDLRKGMTLPDGNIYGMPTIYDPDFTSVLMGSKLWYNKEWLDALGVKEPETVDEFYEFLVAIKKTDLNGNGKPDEIPFGSYSISDVITKLSGYWGLMNRGVANSNIDMDPETDKLRYVPADERYKDLLQFLNKLYTEGLLEPEIFTLKANEFFAKGAENTYGVVLTTSPETLMNQKSFVGLPALQGPFGDRLVPSRSSLTGAGAFVITDKNKYPEATVRWMDYFYSEEGNKMFFMGFKDKSYIETADGQIEYTDEIKNNPQGLTLEQALVKYVTWPGGSYPGIVRQKYFKGAESLPASIEATDKLKPYLTKEVWPVFTFTEEESERYQSLHPDINAYMEEMRAKFITGAAPFSEWDTYVDTLKKMGLDEYLEIYSTAYERYKSS
ncbi:extracellular solute-binding protein [Paenibacillus residui]|uniref:Extracellular solute-binding protein n=1 Tax=Paenibacillus residui TaxID=629724 RepID=A0ABW3D7G2_9BACL